MDSEGKMNERLCRAIEFVERHPQDLAFFQRAVKEAKSLDKILGGDPDLLDDEDITALAAETFCVVHLYLDTIMEILPEVKTVPRWAQEICEELGRDLLVIVSFIETFSATDPPEREFEVNFPKIFGYRASLLEALKKFRIAKDGETIDEVYERQIIKKRRMNKNEARLNGPQEVDYQSKSGKASKSTNSNSNDWKEAGLGVQSYRPAGKGAVPIEKSPYYTKQLATSHSKSGQQQDFVASSSKKLEDVIDVSDSEEDPPDSDEVHSSEDDKQINNQRGHRNSIGISPKLSSFKKEKERRHGSPTQNSDSEEESQKGKQSLGRKSATVDHSTATYAGLQNEIGTRREYNTARWKGKSSKSGKAATLDYSFRGRDEGPSRRFEDPTSYLEEEHEEPEAMNSRASTMPTTQYPTQPPAYTAGHVRAETLYATNFPPQPSSGPYPPYVYHPSAPWPMSPPATAVGSPAPTSVTTNITGSFNVYGNQNGERPARRQTDRR